MNKRELPGGLHLVLGDSAAGVFRQAFEVRDQLLIDQDVLSCGPTPRCDDLARWSQLRWEYWAKLIPGQIGEFVRSPCNLVQDAHRLREAEHIYIWTATGVSEQLFVAFAAHLLGLFHVSPARASIVQFEFLRNRRSLVRGTGELNEEQMRDHPASTAMSGGAVRDYLGAWAALTAPEPNQIEKFADDYPTANPWLKRAMELMLRRFPDKRSGLPHWDYALLENVRKRGPRAVRVIGHTMGENFEDGDLVGDWYLFGRLLGLGDARLPRPLLILSGAGRDMRQTEAALTPFGEAVLDGAAAFHASNPIDDWACGVRLSSAESSLWFREGTRLIRC
jgi:hypothetical protein